MHNLYLIVQGPPGTGKTRSLLAYIELMVKNKPLRPITPLLACTDTNAAVDNIVEGLVDRGIKVVRLGQPAKVCIWLTLQPFGLTSLDDRPSTLLYYRGVSQLVHLRCFTTAPEAKSRSQGVLLYAIGSLCDRAIGLLVHTAQHCCLHDSLSIKLCTQVS